MGDAQHDEVVWPGELDEQLITELLNDDSLLLGAGAPQPVPAAGGGGGSEHCPRGTGPPSAAPAPCNSGAAAEHELLQPEAVSRALCSVYSGPTIRDIEKALSSSSPRTYPWSSSRCYSPMHLFGAASRARESRYTTKVRSCAGKTPSDGYKWRKYGQKSIKNNPHPRSYYKCTSSRCGAKKHVEKSVDDPDVLVVKYEGPHLHGPQPLLPRRQWASVDLAGVSAAAGKSDRASVSDKQTTSSTSPAAAATTPPAAPADDDDAAGGSLLLAPNQLAARDVAPPLLPEWRRAEDAALLPADHQSCCDDDGCSTASAPAAAALRCDSPPAAWSCPDLPFPWSLELEAPLL